jgi:uncharacterized membrane protein YhdT
MVTFSSPHKNASRCSYHNIELHDNNDNLTITQTFNFGWLLGTGYIAEARINQFNFFAFFKASCSYAPLLTTFLLTTYIMSNFQFSTSIGILSNFFGKFNLIFLRISIFTYN